jgi:hypothetical protein
MVAASIQKHYNVYLTSRRGRLRLTISTFSGARHSFLHQQQTLGAPCSGFPVEFVSVDELQAAFLNESRTRGSCLVPRTGNPGQAAFWLEWETTAYNKVGPTVNESMFSVVLYRQAVPPVAKAGKYSVPYVPPEGRTLQ